MIRKSALVFGVALAAWFALDVTATNAEACWGCRRSGCGGGCGSSCGYGGCGSYGYSGCGYGGCGYRGCGYGGCGSSCGYGGCGSSCGMYRSGCNTCYAAPVYAAPACSTCSTGYAVPGAYGYTVRFAPNYGPSYVQSRAGVPSTIYPSSNPSYASPVAAYRTNSVLRTSYATPVYATPVR